MLGVPNEVRACKAWQNYEIIFSSECHSVVGRRALSILEFLILNMEKNNFQISFVFLEFANQ